MKYKWVTWRKNRHSLYEIMKVEAGSPWGKLRGNIEACVDLAPNTWEITPEDAQSVLKTCTLEEAKATLIAMVTLT